MTGIIKYLILVLIGFLLIFLCSFLQHVSPAIPGEYYYSSFLRNNYTTLTGFVFFPAGLSIGYYTKWNPFFSGLSLLAIYPLTTLYEAAFYKGSHNLLPFELLVYCLYALPAIIGAYAGRFIFVKISRVKK